MGTTTSGMGFYLPAVSDKINTVLTGIADNFRKLDASSTSSSPPSTSSGTDVQGGIMPVGSIYINTKNVDPKKLFGGEWRSINNAFLVAQGTMFAAGSTGGASEHRHEENIGFDGNALFAYGKTNGDRTPYYGSIVKNGAWGLVWERQWEIRQTPLRVGYTSNANHLPPYRAVYMWERTA